MRSVSHVDPGRLRSRLEDRRDQVLDIATQHGARNVRVFGSVARSDHSAHSDIDLLVDLGPGVTFFMLGRLRRRLSELLDSPVDIVSAGALLPRDADIVREARSL